MVASFAAVSAASRPPGIQPAGSPATSPWRGVVEQLSFGGEAEWEAYVDAHPGSNCYHRYAWRTVADRAYGLRTPFLVARDRPGGAVRGVLPLFVVEGPFSRFVTTALFGGYGAILADSEGVRRALIEEAREITRDLRAGHLKIKAFDEPACPPGFTRLDLGSVATLSLLGGPDAVWKRFGNNIRNRIKHGQHAGLELRVGPDQLPHFYEVLAGNYHRKGTPIYGYRVMQELCATMGDRAEVVCLWKDGAPLTGALVLYDADVVNVPFVSSRPECFNLNPNNLVYWEIIARACARGMRTLDFGRSPNGSGPLTFKLRWGSTAKPQPYFVYTAYGDPPTLNVEAPAVQRLIKLWQHLPRPVADAFGPWVHGHFLV